MTFTSWDSSRPGSKTSALRGLLVAVLIGLLVALMAAPAPAATEKELAKARKERAAVQAELDRTVAAYDAAQAKLAETQASIEKNSESLKVAEVDQQQARARLSERADVMYRRGPVAIFQFLVGAESLSDFGVRMKLIEGAAKQDSTTIAEATRISSEVNALQQQLVAEEQQQKDLLASMSGQTRSLTDNFTKAQTMEARLASDREAAAKAEQEKATKAAAADAKAKAEAAEKPVAPAPAPPAPAPPPPAPAPAPAKVLTSPTPPTARLAGDGPAVPVGRKGSCPVAGPVSFTDTWGAPRSGGRSHQGVDMFAAMRTPAAAIVDGTLLRRQTSSLGGLSVYLNGDDGNEYFYTHLAGYSDVAPGQKVKAGEIIGYVGDSGNAKGGPPHLHFEIRSGGVPINPTPAARAACGK